METMTLNCTDGVTLIADGDRLIVKTKKADETIPISQIQSFTLQKPGMMYGKIIFKTAQAATGGVSIGFGFSAAIGAERTFFYKEKDYKLAVQFRDYITNYKPHNQTVVSVAAEIRELKALLDEGILTQEEFDAKKKQLLGI